MLKTATFAITHFVVAFTVAYLLTGSIGVSSLLALVEPMVNTVAYFFHEKLWDRVRSRQLDSRFAGHDRLWRHEH
ncbi:DUF2061 domain-containing protein [Chitiniphilus purpureus]|uniref:DUF2061 domain-containing protein n=1 Tax=Chitiniphilus purpureus TaxID=2981137 RepID=A0ABY6DJ51_9NEIS|nr:DUF2061 domain-containing protein [Chitiniphilus sp. CD1]UXY14377.1 DUF2061 domain-containing protein [Chitiniphilus sp. CD1]